MHSRQGHRLKPVTGEQEELRADARRNRARIVAAAREAFAEDGLEVGVAAIAERAGVGNATIFRRFSTKQELITAVIEQRMSELLATARAATTGDDPADGLAVFLDHAVRTHVEDQGLVECAAAQFHGEPRLVELRDALLAEMTTLLRRAQAEGSVRADLEPEDIPVLMFSIAAAAQVVGDRPSGLYRRYLALALSGLRPHPDDVPLAPPAPSVEEIDRGFAAR